MPTVTFIEHNGTEHVIETESGQLLMQVAINHQIPGILADCGGSVTCGTCHCYVSDAWADKLEPPGEDEAMMLDGILHTLPTSRLTCQIRVEPELDGLVVRLPESQT
ncbi:ferredoxin [Burkholderia sp. H160]|nr:ferredoxin [Burkholderia sp. H160]